jgi:hypothetical protein
VYALNARTGAIVWQNNSSGMAYSAADHVGVTPAGVGSVVRGAYWQRAIEGRNGIYAMATGVLAALPAAVASHQRGGPETLGGELGLLDSTHVVYGGRMLYGDMSDRVFNDRKRTIIAQGVDAQGNAMYPEVGLMMNSLHGAWDSQHYVSAIQSNKENGWIERWSTAAYTRMVDSIQQANAASTQVTLNWTTVSPLAQWNVTAAAVNGLALGRNAVVVLRPTWGESWDIAHWQWNVYVISRDNGATLWSAQLPCEPVQSGVAVSANGDIIVALRSGAVLCYGSGTVAVSASTPGVPQPGQVDVLPQAAGWQQASAQPPATSVPGLSLSVSGPVSPAANHRQPQSPGVSALESAESAMHTSAPIGAACRTEPAAYAASHVAEARSANPRADMAWRPERECLAVTHVKASSAARANGATFTGDRSLVTRWAPSEAGPQWLLCDLGVTQDISGLTVVWYGARAARTPFRVEVSIDGARFDMVDSGMLEGRGTRTMLRTFVPVSARYVRLALAPGAGEFAPSFYEIGIHSSAAQQAMAE